MMLNKFSMLLCIFLIIIVLSIASCVKTPVKGGGIWKPVYLRSQMQKKGGIPGGEGMAFIFGISYAPSNPDIAYFVSDHSGVWKGEWKRKGELKEYPNLEGFFWKSMRGYFDEKMNKHRGFRPIGGTSIGIDPFNEDVVFVSGTRHTRNTKANIKCHPSFMVCLMEGLCSLGRPPNPFTAA